MGGEWVDNTVDIATVDGSWAEWAELTTPGIYGGIRLVCTTVDTNDNQSKIAELEIRG
ncbi:hypothetical protein ES703_109777 [subsurface metagenome]